VGLLVAGTRRAKEREGCAEVVTSDDLRELAVLDSVRRADVERGRPCLASVATYRDLRVAAAVLVTEIDCATRTNSDRRVGTVIGRSGGAVRHGGICPGLAVVAADGHALTCQPIGPLAVELGQVDRAIRAHLEMARDRAA